MNRNIRQHPVTTRLVTRVEVNDKGGWIRYGLDRFHFIDGINTSKGQSCKLITR